MLRRHLSAAVPAALLFAATAALAPGSFEDQGPAQPVDLAGAIGVVDFERLSEQYRGTKERLDELNAVQQMAQEEIDRINDELKAGQAILEGLRKGTPEYLEAAYSLRMKSIEGDERAKFWDSRLERKRLELGNDLFAELERGVEAFAEAKRLQLVLRELSIPGSLTGARETNDHKELIYYAEPLDVTAQCVEFLKTWKPAGAPGNR